VRSSPSQNSMAYSDPEQQKRYQRERNASIRKRWLETHGPCRGCGSWERLEVHHIDKSKKVDHKVWSWAPERRDGELKKCEVLCFYCHKKNHAVERIIDHPHGTRARYDKGCRCSVCTQVKINSVYEWRVRRGANGKSSKIIKADVAQW
jgi:hypothetical protein